MNIKIITFHSAYNYGAVLQAYALQQYLLSKKFNCEIINYRPARQRDFNSLYPKHSGIKRFIKNILLIKYDGKRRKRIEKFEIFFQEKFILTKEYCDIEELTELNESTDVFIAGSDQIWNTTKIYDVNAAYFLNFVDSSRKKIAYAASIGNATRKDLLTFYEDLQAFAYISCREKGGAETLRSILKREVSVVADPSLLIENEVYLKLTAGKEYIDDDYIFYYSLDGFDKRKNNVEELRTLSEKTGKKIVAITPEWPKNEPGFTNITDAGPIEFLSLIKNADIVCTNSFHGTALAIALKKDFYVLESENSKDERKSSILNILGLNDRKIKGRETVSLLEIVPVNYDQVEEKLEILKEASRQFLEQAIGTLEETDDIK